MTDLYEALRAAIAPDGRVRLTLPLLTAMREESERRDRGESAAMWRERAFAAEGALTVRLAVRREVEEALGMVPGLTDEQALQRGLDAVRALRERAETAERERDEARRELEGAEREADSQRELRKRAEVERDAAHERAETAERERAEATSRFLDARARARAMTQDVIDAIGSVGPESVEQAVARLVAAHNEARRDLRDLLAHARACLDPANVWAHARLAALLERIEGA